MESATLTASGNNNNVTVIDTTKNNDPDVLWIQCDDGTRFVVDRKSFETSKTIMNLVEDSGTEQDIPLPNVNRRTLEKVIEYAKQHRDDPRKEEPKNEEVIEGQPAMPELPTGEISEWDLNYTREMDQETLFNVILAANYLDMRDLLMLGCRTVANMIKGKTPEEIRQMFGIENDFTPEEEERVRKENEWLNEE